jgi:hypothetical protein
MIAASCSNESVNDVENAVENIRVPVTVNVSGFSVSQEEFSDGATRNGSVRGTTRAAADPATYDGVKALTLAFYAGDGTEAYKHEQVKGSLEEGETFGQFSLSLPMGSYTMVVLAYGKNGDDDLVLTSSTEAAYTGSHTRETFATTQAVNINSTNSVNLSATLNRIIAKLQVVSTDGRAANATNVRMSFAAGGKSFNPTTGLATIDTGFVNTVGISASAGSTSSAISYLFLATDEQDVNVTIETLDEDGAVLFSKTVENVPFKRNRVTRLSGAMYTNSSVSGGFQIETAWEEQYDGTF